MTSNRLHELLPTGSLLLAATLWGALWFPLRQLNEAGLDGVWTSLIAYSTVMLLALPVFWRHRKECANQFVYLLCIGLASGWCNLAFILAMLDGTVVRVILLFYLSPLWAILLGRLILGEKMSRTAMMILSVAMIGALMMLWSPELGFPWPQSTSDWLAISSGLAFAFSNVMIRMRPEVSITNKVIASWWAAIGLCLVWLVFHTSPLPDVALGTIGGAMALGVIALGLATIAVQYGVSQMPVHRSAVILLFELIVGAVTASLLTDEVVRPVEWLGGAMILASAWLTATSRPFK